MAPEVRLCMTPRYTCSDLKRHYDEKGWLQVRKFLEEASADALLRCLETFTRWNLVFLMDGKHTAIDAATVRSWPIEKRRKLEEIITEQALDRFQYCYAAIPIYEIYHQNLLPGHLLNGVFAFLNSRPVIEFARSVTGDPTIEFADAQATRFERGNFLTCHDDDVQGKDRRAAYVLNLTPVWRPEWGGALSFLDAQGNVELALTPAFNVMNIFRVPADHFVGVVAPFAGGPRLSITGWFRAGRDPGH